MKRYAFVPVAIVAAVSLSLSGCSSSGSSTGGSDGSSGTSGGGTIKLGLLESETGPFSSIGLPEVQGAKVAADAINAAGGILGKKIELVVEDAQSTPQGASAGATKLITNDHVVGIIGPEATALALATAPIAHANKVPMVSGSASFLVALPAQYLDYTFASAASTAKSFVPLVKYWSTKNITKVGVIGPKGDVFDGVVKAFKAMSGITVVGTEQFQPGQADVTANMTKLLTSHPQAIFIAGQAGDAASAQKAAASLKVDAQIVNLASQGNEGFIKLAGAGNITANTIFLGFPTTVYDSLPADNPGKPAATAFVELMKKQDPNFDPGSLAVLAYNGVYAYRDAITAANSTAPAKIRDALETTKMTNPFGVWQRSATDHDGSQNPYIVASHDSSGWHYLG